MTDTVLTVTDSNSIFSAEISKEEQVFKAYIRLVERQSLPPQSEIIGAMIEVQSNILAGLERQYGDGLVAGSVQLVIDYEPLKDMASELANNADELSDFKLITSDERFADAIWLAKDRITPFDAVTQTLLDVFSQQKLGKAILFVEQSDFRS